MNVWQCDESRPAPGLMPAEVDVELPRDDARRLGGERRRLPRPVGAPRGSSSSRTWPCSGSRSGRSARPGRRASDVRSSWEWHRHGGRLTEPITVPKQRDPFPYEHQYDRCFSGAESNIVLRRHAQPDFPHSACSADGMPRPPRITQNGLPRSRHRQLIGGLGPVRTLKRGPFGWVLRTLASVSRSMRARTTAPIAGHGR
jgi:hypothetical protein